MNKRWQDVEDQVVRPKLEPWMSFGVAIIVAVVAVLFAAGTWVIRSGQAERARERSAKLSEQLTLAQREISQLNEQRSLLESESDSRQQRIHGLETSEVALQQNVAKLQAELDSVKREVDGTKGALAEMKRKDMEPTTLPPSKLADLLRGKSLRIRVSLQEDGNSNLSEGAIREKTKQACETKGSITFNDSSTTFLTVRVVALSDVQGRTSIAVTMRVEEPWKVPGANSMHWVAVWQQQTLGVTSADSAQPFTDKLIDDVVDAMVKEIK